MALGKSKHGNDMFNISFKQMTEHLLIFPSQSSVRILFITTFVWENQFPNNIYPSTELMLGSDRFTQPAPAKTASTLARQLVGKHGALARIAFGRRNRKHTIKSPAPEDTDGQMFYWALYTALFVFPSAPPSLHLLRSKDRPSLLSQFRRHSSGPQPKKHNQWAMAVCLCAWVRVWLRSGLSGNPTSPAIYVFFRSGRPPQNTTARTKHCVCFSKATVELCFAAWLLLFNKRLRPVSCCPKRWWGNAGSSTSAGSSTQMTEQFAPFARVCKVQFGVQQQQQQKEEIANWCPIRAERDWFIAVNANNSGYSFFRLTPRRRWEAAKLDFYLHFYSSQFGSFFFRISSHTL